MSTEKSIRQSEAFGDSDGGVPEGPSMPNPHPASEPRADEITRLPDAWMDEADEHTRDGEMGIAEGLRTAADELTLAIRKEAKRVGEASVEDLIEASSLGTPEAVVARESVSRESVAPILRRVSELDAKRRGKFVETFLRVHLGDYIQWDVNDIGAEEEFLSCDVALLATTLAKHMATEPRAEVSEELERLVERGVGTDLNPTRLVFDEKGDSWWCDYLRRHDQQWRDRIADALATPSEPADDPRAEAWDEGYDAGMSDTETHHRGDTRNPYRTPSPSTSTPASGQAEEEA